MEELQIQLERGLHNSASLAVYSRGRKLLDITSGQPVNTLGTAADSNGPPLYRAFSSGKALVAAVMWRLLDAGAVGIDDPVAKFWPEFMRRGKGDATLRHALTHTSGLPFEPPPGNGDWGDWGRVTDIIAGMPLETRPGEVIQYHALTFGWIVGEIAARVSGLSFDEVFEREVKIPLGLSDTSFAIDPDGEETLGRVTRLTTSNDHPDPQMPTSMNQLLLLGISAPGGTCLTTASDLARLYATVSNGGVTPEGQMWLTEEAARNVYAVHKRGYDIDDMSEKLVGQGVWLVTDDHDRSAGPIGSATFGHGGMGTSVGWGDPEHGLGFAFLSDNILPEDRNAKRLNRISAAVRRDLGIPTGHVAEMP